MTVAYQLISNMAPNSPRRCGLLGAFVNVGVFAWMGMGTEEEEDDFREVFGPSVPKEEKPLDKGV